MKSVTILFTIFLTALLLFSTQLASAEEAREISPNAVKSIYFNIYKSLGAVKGYVIFRDENGNMCATNGILSLTRKTTHYVTEKSILKGYEKIAKTEKKHLKDIRFNPSDFQIMELRGGDTIYALPISLDASKINKGNVIILKWYGFEERKEIY